MQKSPSLQISARHVLILVACLLVPLLVLGFFSFPSADDYAYSVKALKMGFWAAQIDWYQTWSGRYIATALMSLNPVAFHWDLGYKLVGPLTFLLFMASSWFFITALLRPLLDREAQRTGYLWFSLMYLCEMPSITEGFHWYPGVVNYMLALILFLFGLGFYIRTTQLSFAKNPVFDPRPHWLINMLVLGVISFLLPGINESLVIVWLFLIVMLGFFIYRRHGKIEMSLLVPIFLGLFSFYIVYKAPGNIVRSGVFPGRHRVLFTLFRPLGLEVELFFRYLKPSVFLFLIMIVPWLARQKDKIASEFYSARARWLAFAGYVMMLFLFLAPAHWAIGGAPPRRAMNVLCYIHLVMVFVMLAQWVWARPDKVLAYERKITHWIPSRWLAALFVVTLFAVSNVGQMWADLLFRAGTYAHEQGARNEKLLQAGPAADVVLPPLTYKPESLYFSDVTEDPNDWINQSVSDYFHVHSVVVGSQ